MNGGAAGSSGAAEGTYRSQHRMPAAVAFAITWNISLYLETMSCMPPPRRRRLRPHLSCVRDVRREMGWVYRRVREGQLPPQDGTRLVYMLQTIARTLELELGTADRGAPTSDKAAYPATDTTKLLDELISRASADSATASPG